MSLIRILIASMALTAPAVSADRVAAPVYQLRICEIFESTTAERTEFVYLLERRS